jgi:hypothetical protein
VTGAGGAEPMGQVELQPALHAVGGHADPLAREGVSERFGQDGGETVGERPDVAGDLQVQHARTVSTGWDVGAGAWGSRSVGTRGRGVGAGGRVRVPLRPLEEPG